MPPFSQKPPTPPKRKGLIVQVPICAWCKQRIGYPCKGCERITCYQCLVSFEGGECVHMVYTPVQNTGWGIVCTNLMCNDTCNICQGRGILW